MPAENPLSEQQLRIGRVASQKATEAAELLQTGSFTSAISLLGEAIELARIAKQVNFPESSGIGLERAGLSAMKINVETRQVYLDNRVSVVSGDIQWAVFLVLAQNANQDVHTLTIREIAERAGSRSYRGVVSGQVVAQLRQALEVDSKNPVFVTRSGLIHNSYYRLNAEVEFVDSSFKANEIKEAAEEKEVPKVVVDLGKREVALDERTLNISGDVQWATFLRLALNAKQQISSGELSEIAMAAGSNAQRASNVVGALRRSLEVDYKRPRILLRSGNANKAFYTLNANVEILDEGYKPGIADQIDLSMDDLIGLRFNDRELAMAACVFVDLPQSELDRFEINLSDDAFDTLMRISGSLDNFGLSSRQKATLRSRTLRKLSRVIGDNANRTTIHSQNMDARLVLNCFLRIPSSKITDLTSVQG